MNLTINHLQHTGIPVTDLNRSETFYQKLGFKNVMTSGFEFKGDKGKVAMMQNGSVIIEIYQMPEKELAEIRSRKNGHIDHVAFDVSDIDKAFNELKGNGFQIVEDAPIFLPFWKNGCKYFNILGPDGERLEFNQIL
ncbi:MAG: VOC family protein [Bacteroidetes bacterium]|nr:VOC family protein [Bacteroidota bacterium]